RVDRVRLSRRVVRLAIQGEGLRERRLGSIDLVVSDQHPPEVEETRCDREGIAGRAREREGFLYLHDRRVEVARLGGEDREARQTVADPDRVLERAKDRERLLGLRLRALYSACLALGDAEPH